MKINKIYFFLIFIFFICFFLYPESLEYYSDYSLKYGLNKNYSIKFKANLRFRDSKNYYNKIFSGISKKINRKFKIGFYYAIKWKKKETWKKYDFIFPELTYKKKIGSFVSEDRNRIEYFFSSKEYRYRNRLKIDYLLNKKTLLWFGDEIRYYFNKRKIGKNEIFIGLNYKLSNKLDIDLYYDYKSEKEIYGWNNINIIGTKINFYY